MIVAAPRDPARSFAVAVYRPGCAPAYWSFAAAEWRASFDAAACLLPIAADPLSPLGDLLVARIPDAAAVPGAVVQLVSLGPGGRPIETVDCEVVYAADGA